MKRMYSVVLCAVCFSSASSAWATEFVHPLASDEAKNIVREHPELTVEQLYRQLSFYDKTISLEDGVEQSISTVEFVPTVYEKYHVFAPLKEGLPRAFTAEGCGVNSNMVYYTYVWEDNARDDNATLSTYVRPEEDSCYSSSLCSLATSQRVRFAQGSPPPAGPPP